MSTISAQTWIILAGVVALVAVALAAWFSYRKKKQSRRLQERFGPEYGRSVDDLGSQKKAESELKAREKRVEQLTIVPLAPSEAARFSQTWKDLQGRFVDNPKGAVVQADQLVRELMLKRGYPMGDFERRAADISVDHPEVVAHYRAAQAIAVRNERGEADTEELRKAVVHYRALFDELLEVREARQEGMPAEQIKGLRINNISNCSGTLTLTCHLQTNPDYSDSFGIIGKKQVVVLCVNMLEFFV
jgi:FtsZ-interacting cell division protein ZipA